MEQYQIVDEDRLCYQVWNDCNGAQGLRTISKKLLDEFVAYVAEHPNCKANEAREALCGKSDIDRFEYGYCASLLMLAKIVLSKKQNAKNVLTDSLPLSLNLQQIYYGAPGTGKSYEVKRQTKDWEKKGRVVRTTFHPDSDYSTFVGTYKPTTGYVPRCDWEGKPVTDKDGNLVKEQRIKYEFVPQAFLQAYVDAWTNRRDPEYLVIEEINRGNCAQIFGDLFQLLDRGNDGFSEYPIRADKDLQNYLHGALGSIDYEGGKYAKVKSGEELRLPDNLYIMATMNTSDQSLFPIDSAFKRRWDWKYVKITKGVDDDGIELNWYIDLGGPRYSWWKFLCVINERILRTTNSADKQLGFFFCKAKESVIDAEIFVNKVVFYLWNDVFKDYPDNDVFRDPDNKAQISFDDFCEAVGRNVKPVVSTIKKFLENLGLKDETKTADGGNTPTGE